MSPTGIRATALAVLLCVSTVFVGCGGDAPSPPGRVVLVTAPSSDEPQPVLTPTDEDALRLAAGADDGSATLFVAGDPRAGGVVDLVPRRVIGAGRIEVEHGPNRPAMIESKVSAVRSMLAALAPTTGRPDLLRALTDGARSGPPGTMLVLDSGVSTVDPLDLRVLGWDSDVRRVVDDLQARGFLPDLRGWTVRFAGLGAVAGPQQALPEPQHRWLESLWTEICHRAGAMSCEVEPPATSPGPPLSTRPAGPVPVPSVTTVSVGPTRATTIPASLLGFTEGSASLPATASAVLEDILAISRDGRHRVLVEGYVAFWGDEGYRQDLSERRAVAVADLLVAGGVPRTLVVAVGRGAADGPMASQTNGVFDEGKVSRADLRRVVVTTSPVTQP